MRLLMGTVDRARPLGVWTAVLLGTNAIVGSGVYLFPAPLAERLGPLSLVAWTTTAILCAPIAFAYAEMARGTDRSGGTYRYAADAFGPYPGAVLGWVSWISAVVSWAAVANAVPRYLGEFVPALGPAASGKAATGALVALLTVLNILGVRLGAGVSNALTIGKLLPLALLAAAGIAAPFVHADRLAPFAPHGARPLAQATFLVLFAYQGFEVVGIPAGEIRDARRAVARGVLGSMGLAALLYLAVQLGYLAAGSPGGDAPLANAARALYGGWGATALAFGGLVSIVGFNAGTALGSPRYVSSLAQDGWLPRRFAEPDRRFGTPSLAVGVTGGATLVCALFLDFDRLVELANIAVLAQYAATSVALVVLRRASRTWVVVGVLATLACLAMITQAKASEFLSFAIAAAIGAAVLPLLRRRA